MAQFMGIKTPSNNISALRIAVVSTCMLAVKNNSGVRTIEIPEQYYVCCVDVFNFSLSHKSEMSQQTTPVYLLVRHVPFIAKSAGFFCLGLICEI